MVAGQPSLLQTHPEVAAQWDYEHNGDLLPEHVTAESKTVAAWLCMNCSCGHPHQWRSLIHNRTAAKAVCPVCAGRQHCRCKSLEALRPDLAAEWHPKNSPLQPADFAPNSTYEAAWQCFNCDVTSWNASIRSRTRSSLPECWQCRALRLRLARTGDSLAASKHQHLAQQWHLTKNGGLRPEHMTPRSGKEVWWLCDKSTCHHPHEWKTSIVKRTEGGKCPWCRNR